MTLPQQRPAIDVDVVMRREPVRGPMSRWQAWRWVLADVLLRGDPIQSAGVARDDRHEPQAVEPVDGAADPASTHWLFADFRVELFRDDAEGYLLNLNSPTPCFWVVWRSDDAQPIDGEAMAVPQTVTLSYHDAGRWLDAQERVDQVAAPQEVVDWLRGFVDAVYQPEPKRRKRPDSFKTLTDRFGQPVRISTGKHPAGPGHSSGASGAGHGRLGRQFFSRWSRRKVQLRTGQPPPSDPPADAPVAANKIAAAQGATRAAVLHEQTPQPQTPRSSAAAESVPALTLDDVAQLTRESDFNRHVPAEVRNAALKKTLCRPALQCDERTGHLHRRLLQTQPIVGGHCCPKQPAAKHEVVI